MFKLLRNIVRSPVLLFAVLLAPACSSPSTEPTTPKPELEQGRCPPGYTESQGQGGVLICTPN